MSRHLKKFAAQVGRADLDHLPYSLSQQAENCPDCRRILDQTRTVHRLVGLKRYEQPASDSVEQGLSALHLQLVEWEQNRHLAELEDDLPALTGWRYGWAAALLAVLAFNLMAARQMPTMQSTIASSLSPYHAVPMQLASSNRQFRLEAPVHLLAPPQSDSHGRQTILTSFER